MKIIIKKISELKTLFLKLPRLLKIIILAIVLVLISLVILNFKNSKTTSQQYQTAKVEKGTLVVSLAASGQVSNANNASITTQASGVISNLYVKNGTEVKAGDKIAEIDLDLAGKQKSDQALASYLGAKNSLENTKISLYTLQSDMLTKWKTFLDTAQSSSYQNSDNSPKTDARQLPQFFSVNNDWLAAEAKYKNQQAVINQSQISLSNAWYTFQQTSSTVYAPMSGTITGLSLQVGSVISTQTSASTNNTSSQKIANIQTKAYPVITVNLTEIDVLKVKTDDKATITFDAQPNKTFTGKILGVDTVGTTSSGVTTYPAVIKLDTESENIYTNMSAQASIITNIKDSALLVPSSAVQTQNNESFVRVMKNNQITQVPVEIGLSSGAQTEILSGLSENDTVVTNVISPSTSQNNNTQTSSPFGNLGGNRNMGGGGAIRINR